MAKNILIYSDGTGQAGGVRPDQFLSNIYKLYRATRSGPDSPINPAQQIAFYDAGLGSEETEGPLVSRIVSAIRKFLSSAFGTGFTNNVSDCYEAILRHYEPGDRIFLFGFSRGAYTARSVAGVMNLCGVPTKDADGNSIPRSGRALRKIADEAVHTVYEHGAGRPRAKFEEEREEQARRFRIKYQTQNNGLNERGDVVPYFIGVFDTVAALGSTGIKKYSMITVSILGVLIPLFVTSWIVSWIFGWWFWGVLVALGIASALAPTIYNYNARVKVIRDYPKPGKNRRHWSAWRFQHYDKFLDKRVRYARHAQAIDETRATFDRVGWGRQRDHDGAPSDWLVQMWFPGNHSDIGGSYPEWESRLSDIALEWMAKEAEQVPNGIITDWTKLHLFPDAKGVQHCEVESVRDMYPAWVPMKWRPSWSEGVRQNVTYSSCHPTVMERLEYGTVVKCGIAQRYRPEALRNVPEFAQYYSTNEFQK